MMDEQEIFRLTATQIEKQYAKALLARIEARDPVVKAWAYLNPDQVLERARELDRLPAEKRGSLHGVAIRVKDVMNTEGIVIFR